MMSLVFVAALLAGAPAATDPPSAAAPPAVTAKGEKPKPNDMVCKREEVLGSKLKQRVCMIQADWDARRQDGQDELKKAQSLRPSQSN